MQTPEFTLNNEFEQLKCCVLIPTYNNSGTLGNVIQNSLAYTSHIIVINDGSTDSTPEVLKSFGNQITVLNHPKNQGKGVALRNGFKKAVAMGYHNAITIDSDGQHFPSDFKNLLDAMKEHHGALLIGARNMKSENVPGGSSFGNKFSNFWFRVETGITMPDTQSGYRVYPIKRLQELHFYTTRFEFEIEVIVKAAWKGIPVLPVPVKVFYAKRGERVSHFRPGKDFFRISVLNTWLVILAFAWYRPLKILRGLSPGNLKSFIRKHFFNPEESVLKKSLSVSVGIFFGIVPIWGYQLMTAIAAAYFFKLNKVIVILTANISIPPLLPFILLGSIKTGELITSQKVNLSLSSISLKTVSANLYTYLAGACALSVLAAIFCGLLTYVLLSLQAKRKGTRV